MKHITIALLTAASLALPPVHSIAAAPSSICSGIPWFPPCHSVTA